MKWESMSGIKIILEFQDFQIEAVLFESIIAERFSATLPCSIDLQQWGNELYGPIKDNLGEENPIPSIPPGGIAYSTNGSYICIFYGQTPAWPVEHIGQILEEQWGSLLEKPTQNKVTIRLMK